MKGFLLTAFFLVSSSAMALSKDQFLYGEPLEAQNGPSVVWAFKCLKSQDRDTYSWSYIGAAHTSWIDNGLEGLRPIGICSNLGPGFGYGPLLNIGYNRCATAKAWVAGNLQEEDGYGYWIYRNLNSKLVTLPDLECDAETENQIVVRAYDPRM